MQKIKVYRDLCHCVSLLTCVVFIDVAVNLYFMSVLFTSALLFCVYSFLHTFYV